MNREMKDYQKRVKESAAFIKERIQGPLQVILVLGTGLGGVAQKIEAPVILPYQTVPHFPRATAPGHEGNLIFGKLGGKRVAALQGRFHYYEGYSTQELTFPVRVLSLLGPELFIVSNAAGGLNTSYAPGMLMIIRDHLNFIGENPLRGANVDQWGPRFPDFSEVYDKKLVNQCLHCAEHLGISNISTGVYVAVPGPSLETPAETRHLRNCGADAVGMSTVPEVIVAKHAGLRVVGIAVIANINDPDNLMPITLEKIIDQAKKAESQIQELIIELLHGIA